MRRARGAVPRTQMWVFSFQHGGLKGKPCRDKSCVYQISAHAGRRGSDVGLSIPLSPRQGRRCRHTTGLGGRVNLHGGRSDASTNKAPPVARRPVLTGGRRRRGAEPREGEGRIGGTQGGARSQRFPCWTALHSTTIVNHARLHQWCFCLSNKG